MKPSFFGRQKTAICAVLMEPTVERLVAQARNSHDQGADGVCVEMNLLPPGLRTVDSLRAVIGSAPLPFYFADYRHDGFLGADDEARQEGLLNAAEAGAEIIDVMGDLFAPSPFEWTEDPAAVAKQKRLIGRIHDAGAKALMSSHMTGTPRTAEEVLAQLRGQEERGADMLKIVTRCDTEEDLREAVRTFFLLNRGLSKPFVFLGSGRFGRLQRFLGTSLGSAIEFAVPSYQDSNAYNQPTIRAFRAVMDGVNWQC